MVRENGEKTNIVSKGDTVRVHITLRLDDGRVIDSTQGREPVCLTIGRGQTIIPDIEQAIIGMQKGQVRRVNIAVERVQNLYDKEMLTLISGHALVIDIQLVEVIPLNQEEAEKVFKTGVDMQNQGRIDEAISSFKRSILLNPKMPAPYLSLGLLLQQRGYIDDAILLYQQVLELCPGHSDTYNILGSVFQSKDRLDEAIASYHKAIQFNPNSFMAHNNFGSALKLRGDIDGAIKHYEMALKLNPNFPESLNNLGNALRDKNELDKAVSCYRQSIVLKPNFADPHLNLSYALLLGGRFEEGWKEYEWRWIVKEPLLKLPQPLWDGSDIAGKTILLFAEQGFGDTIQFIRYASMVADKGLKVIIGCQKELKSLLANVQGISQIVAYGEPLPQFDFQRPLMSLPMLFKTTLNTIPSRVPYVSVESQLIEQWGKKMNLDKSKINIGLAWAGSPGHVNDRNRSIRLEMFSHLTRIQGFSFFSLQKELTEKTDKHTMNKLQLIDYTDDISDFSDTAGIIMNLDLVISVDTSVAHLAGALAKKVWTLLPFSPDWRWLLNREDSPWYPTMRFFRQPLLGDWKTVIDRVNHALRQECGRMRLD